MAVGVLLLLGLLMVRPAVAQGILADGDAAVTSFSGAMPPPQIAPGQDPAQLTVIDPNGASLRVIQLQSPGGTPQGQVVQAPKGLAIGAAQIGQVFAVTLDNANPPNIYAAATSVYGLPIVGANGQRLTQGAPGAHFMPGLFGPAPGGPGSIWRIDGQTGEVRLFANVTFEGAPNGGAGLGGLAFDDASRTLFVADRETGIIHAFDMNGGERGHYDHGFTGREAGGLPQVQFDPSLRLDITSPQFQPLTPSTWGYAPASRRVFGLAVHEGRLYYAVAENLQVWSVSITPEGAFGTDARVEVTVPPGQGPSEISKIAFDDSGRMLLAERMAPSPTADFTTLTAAGGRVLRYTHTASGWTADEFAVGFAAGNHAGDGGVAVGYGYANGQLDHNACAGFVWMSGEQLRVSADPALAGQLAQGGAANVNGLQGSAADAVLPANAPPLQSYFVDLDDQFQDANARGHVGDVAIRRDCAGGAPAPGVAGTEPGGPTSEQPPEQVAGGPPDFDFGPGGFFPGWPHWPPPPPPVCPVGTHPEPNGVQCCPFGQIPGVSGTCQSPCANGSMALADITACISGFQPGSAPGGANPGVCWNGTAPTKVPGAACAAVNSYACNKCPKPPLKRCPAGMHEVSGGVLDASWAWSDQHCAPIGAVLCPVGQQANMNGVCQTLCPPTQIGYPVNRCCVNGTHVNALGQCPGVIVPPQWYLDFLVTGSGPCLLPSGNCSYYEFTLTGRQRFGQGSLRLNITLPPDSSFPTPVIRGSKYCPPSAWKCSKSGNGFTCSAEDCGLAPGDQVVLRTEGRVAPNLTQPPPAPIDKTACATLDWQALPGPGRTVIEQLRDTGKTTPPPSRAVAGVGTDQFGRTTSSKACWTIRVLARTPSCPPNYVQMPSGQCCLASQVAGGQCCPAGQKPDARRQACVPVRPPAVVIPPVVVPPRVVTPPPGRPCPPGQHLRRGRCVPDIVRCPPDTHRVGRHCVPNVRPCPPGTHRVGRRCLPNVRACPPGTHRVGRHCAPNVRACPPGTHRVRSRCVPTVRQPTDDQRRPIRR